MTRHSIPEATEQLGDMQMPFPEPTQLIDRELIFRFFWRFAALEAALMADPFLRRVRQNLAPDPNWKRFTKRLEDSLRAWDSEPFRQSATALLECNVRRQVVRNGELTWELLAPSDSQVAFTIDTVICVRNTLFHGGKYSGGAMDIARDRRVIQAALDVLNECYELHKGVRRAIDDISHAA